MPPATPTTPSTPAGKPPSMADVKALSSLLLIGHKSPTKADADSSAPLRAADEQAWAEGARASRLASQSGAARAAGGGVNVKGYRLTPADVLSMDEKSRLALMERVSRGGMSIDDALGEIVEHQRQRNCAIM